MKKTLLFTFVILSLLLAACSGGKTTATTEPAEAVPAATNTVAPTEAPAPTEEPPAPAEEPSAPELSPEEQLAMLQFNPWQWVSFTSPVEQFDLEMPEAYLLNFAGDGTVQIVADCNNAFGDYTVDGSSLTIVVGPMTLAACPPDSHSDQFVNLLGSAATYFFEDGNLFIDLMADGGTLEFAPADAELLADDGEGAMADALWANSWNWVSFTNPAEQYDIEMPENYVLTFYEDGALTIVADCNTVLASYTDDAGALTITPGPSTLVACSPESRSDRFVQLLEGAARYFYEDGSLFIDLMADGGTLQFAPQNLDGLVDEDAIGNNMSAELIAQLDAFLQSQVYTAGGNPNLVAPGMVLLVDTPAGRYLNAAGVSNLEDGTPMQVDDILEIGSNTKSMTVVVLMQLVEEGLLTLDDPLAQWLPEEAALFPNGDQMTLRQLAQHTAGLWDYGDDIIGGGVTDPALLETSYTPEELIQYAADNGTPYFEPGAEGKWHYSNTGYVLLGMILEKVTGQSLAELYQTRIFDPFGMESASLIEGVPQPGQITTHGYWFENGASVDTTRWNGSQGWAAGAAAMTAADLATYAHQLAMEGFFQNPETLAEMLTFDPSARFGVGAPYGLGLFDVAGDGTVWGHAGQTLGFQSLWFTDPTAGIVVVGLTNSAAYSAYNLVNVRHILQGAGTQPFGPVTLLPVGDLVPTTWAWTQFENPAESIAIDAGEGLTVDIVKDQSVTVKSAACGEAYGTYTTDGSGTIHFELDDSGMTCEADSLAGQFVQHLKDATLWHFDNGSLIIELPADGGSLIFTYVTSE